MSEYASWGFYCQGYGCGFQHGRFEWYQGEKATVLGDSHTKSFRNRYDKADYIVVEPSVSTGWPRDPLTRYLGEEEAAYSRCHIGGFELYIKRPPAIDVHLAWAKRHEATGDLDEASAEYQKVKDIDPGNETALKALVDCDLERGKMEM